MNRKSAKTEGAELVVKFRQLVLCALIFQAAFSWASEIPVVIPAGGLSGGATIQLLTLGEPLTGSSSNDIAGLGFAYAIPLPLPAPSGLIVGFADGFSTDTLKLGWTDNSGDELSFIVERSTDGVSYTQISQLPSNTTTYTDTGLAAASRYWYRAKARNVFKDSEYSAPQDTYTRAAIPDNTTFAAVYLSSVSVNWTVNGNPAGTLYRVAVSTAPDPSNPGGAVATSSDTYDAYISSDGLAANTTYYFRVAGVNNNGVESNYTAAQGTSTLANVPVFNNFTNVGISAIQFNWLANGNPDPGTLYRVKVSTAPDPLSPTGAVVTMSDTYNVYLSSTGLNVNTTYYFRVAGVNNNGLESGYSVAQGTSTIAAPPVTKLYLQDTVSSINPGADDERILPLVPGSAIVTYTKTTVAGPVNPPDAATQFTSPPGVTNVIWYSQPLDAVTISGDVTFNIWAGENPPAANATMTAELLRTDNSGAIQSIIASVVPDRTELTTALMPQTWVKTSASTALSNGDRLAVRVYIDDALGFTMASGKTVTVTLGGGTPGSSGDSWVGVAEVLAPAQPVIGAITSINIASITANWSLVDGATGYTLAASTNPGSQPYPIAASSTTLGNLSAVVASLASNTTYYLFVRTNGPGASSSWAAYPGVSSLANEPVFTGFANVSPASIQYNWSANGNPPGTLYRVKVSTVPDPLNPGGAMVMTSETYDLYLNSSGLNANTTYYIRVAGVNNSGIQTAYTAAQSTSTLAALPAGLYFSGVTSDLIRLNWSGISNGPGTIYRVLVSTAPDPLAPAGAVLTSSDTYNVYLSSAGLLPDTSYYFRAAAINNNGIITAYTAPVMEKTLTIGGLGSPAAGSITNVHITSITADWSLVNGATGYTLVASLSPDYPPSAIYASSTTVGPDLIATIFENSALSPNTVYYIFVRANGPDASGAWFTYPAVSTLVEFTPVFTGFTNVVADAAQLNWSSNGNPYPGTQYSVVASTAPDPLSPGGAVVIASDTYNVNSVLSGLAANATYYFRVAGLNKDGIAAGYSAAQSTSTLANVPVFNSFTNITEGALQFNWSANGNSYPNTRYRMAVSTAPDPLNPGGAMAMISDTYDLYLSSTGLSASTTYYFRVAGINNNGIITSYTAVYGISTWANMPIFTDFTNVGADSVQVNWSANANPYPGTLYRVSSSTAPDPLTPGGALVTTADTVNLYMTFSGLASNSTYYFRAAGINSNGVVTNYTSAFSTVTLQAIATKLYFQDAVSSINPGADDERMLTRSPGAAVVTYTKNTVVGPVNPPDAITQFTGLSGTNVIWYSAPLGAVTIAGPVTFNIWAAESHNPANAAITAELLRTDNSGVIQSVIASVVPDRTELPLSAAVTAPQAWVKTSAFTTLSNGERLAVRLYIDDAIGFTMTANGRNVATTIGGGTSGAAGDSWVQLTEALTPAHPVVGAITGIYVASMTASWSLVDGATGYTLAASTNPANPPYPIAASSTTLGNLSATVDSLASNTTYYLFVRSNGPGASSSWAAYPGAITLANMPVFTGFTYLSSTTIKCNWSANGNPAGTLYRAKVSTAPDPLNPGAAVVTASTTYDLYVSTTGLNAETTYYFCAQAENSAGIQTLYAGPVSTMTTLLQYQLSSVKLVDGNPEIIITAEQAVELAVIGATDTVGAVVLTTAAAQGFTLVSDIYELKPEGVTFTPPLELVFRYSTTTLALLGINENDVALYHYNSTSGLMEYVTGQIKNTTDKTITAYFSSLDSIFITLGKKRDMVAPVSLISAGKPSFEAFGLKVITPVTLISVSAQDEGEGASGVDKRFCAVDSEAFTEYTAPFAVTTQGEHIVKCRATDKAGNVETVKEMRVAVMLLESEAVESVTSIMMSGTAEITGAVRANALATLNGGAKITGDVTASDAMLKGKAIITGRVTKTADTLIAEPIALGPIAQAATALNNNNSVPSQYLQNGMLKVTSKAGIMLSTGTYYFKGIELTGGASVVVHGNVNVMVEGPVNISGGSAFNAEGPAARLKLFVNSELPVTLSGGGRAAAFVYAPKSALKLSDTVRAEGHWFAKSVEISGNGNIIQSVENLSPIKTANLAVLADGTFRFGEVYVFPNPAKGGAAPTFHIECGIADKITIKVYTVSGRLAHEYTITGAPTTMDDGNGLSYAYEHVWSGHIPSGVYYYYIEAAKAGKNLEKTGKFAVVR